MLVASAALAGIVAVAADGQPLRGPASEESGALRLPLLDVVVALVALSVVFGLVVLVAALSGERTRPGTSHRRRGGFLRTAVTTLLVLGVVAALANLRGEEAPEVPEQAPIGIDLPVDAPPVSDAPVWPVLVLAGIAGLALVLAFAASRRGEPATTSTDEHLAETVAPEQRRIAGEAFDASIDELRREPDPRRAVVRAYARLLDGLERAGLGRRLDEAPHEHLIRALDRLDVAPGPLQVLTDLFAEARFSLHAIGAGHQQAAVDALVAARSSLTEDSSR